MPICYEIDIDIIGNDEEGNEYPTRLPRRSIFDTPPTPEQLRREVEQFWEQFAALLGDTAPDRANRYRNAGTFNVTSIYNC